MGPFQGRDYSIREALILLLEMRQTCVAFDGCAVVIFSDAGRVAPIAPNSNKAGLRIHDCTIHLLQVCVSCTIRLRHKRARLAHVVFSVAQVAVVAQLTVAHARAVPLAFVECIVRTEVARHATLAQLFINTVGVDLKF